jgi:SNF2 family DNA or RNA helicase
MLTPERAPRSFKMFQSETMTQVSVFRWVPKPDANEKVRALLQPSVRFTRDQCVDLPPVTYSDRDIPLTDQQKRLYEEMRNDLLVELAEGKIVAANEGVKLSKLLQIAGGFIYGAGAAHRLPVEPRLSELDAILEQAASKVIIFAPFIEAVKIISDHFTARRQPHHVVHGDVGQADRNAIFNAFQFTAERAPLVAHPQTMAHGLTLTAASTIVWYLPAPSLEIYEQANARITRPGQTLHQHVVHLRGSEIERRVYKRLASRGAMQGVLLDMLRGVDYA